MATSLDEMSALARALLEAEQKSAKAEAELKAVKEAERVIREETIPSAMQELGITMLQLDTGQKLTVKQEVYASIPVAQKPAAFAWLNDNGFGSLIKVEVVADFRKGEQDAANELFAELKNRGMEVEFDEGVHAQTLKAFLKEQIGKGAVIPLDLFGARPVWTAKISSK